MYTIFPDIIPILTLSSCTLVLLTKSIFSIIHYHKYRKSNIPKKPYEIKSDRLEVTNRDIKIHEKDNYSYSDSSPILTPIPEDFLRKKPKRSFFGSGQYTVESKRNSSNSISTQYASYFPEALRLFSSGDNNNNNNNNSNNNSQSDLAERIMALNEGNYFGRDERTGEPIVLLKDPPADQNTLAAKIKNLSHGKLVGDSIVSVGKSIPDRFSNNHGKRLSDVGIICNTDNKEEYENIREEILLDQDDNNTPYTSSGSGRSSTINRTRSTRSTQTTATNASTVDDNSPDNNNLKKKISSISLNQQNNLRIITEKKSNDDDGVDDINADDKSDKAKPTST